MQATTCLCLVFDLLKITFVFINIKSISQSKNHLSNVCIIGKNKKDKNKSKNKWLSFIFYISSQLGAALYVIG